MNDEDMNLDDQRPVCPLRCPSCEDTNIHILEDYVGGFEVHGINSNGYVLADDSCEIFWDAASNTRFVCMECNHEWPVGSHIIRHCIA